MKLDDMHWCRIDGVQSGVDLLELVNTKKSRPKPEKILRGIYKEMEEERAGKRRPTFGGLYCSDLS